VQLTAWALFRDLRDGRRGLSEIEALVQELTVQAFQARARNLAAYLGELDPEANGERLAALLDGLLGDADPKTAQERLSRVYFGFVFTAHPTFALAERLQRLLCTLAVDRDPEGKPLGAEARRALLEEAGALVHGPDAEIDLEREQAQALFAIGRLRAAVRRLYRIAWRICRARYGAQALALTPRLVGIASWVGYDTDGRRDIPWTETFHRRLRAQLVQLEDYRRRIASLRERAEGPEELASVLGLIEARLALTLKSLGEVAAVLAEAPGDDSWLDRLAAAGRELAESADVRLRHRDELAALLSRALAHAASEPVCEELWVLRAEAAHFGLAAAHTHLRINAVQLHNAIRHVIGMEHHPEDPTWRLTYREAVAERIARIEPVAVNLGSLAHEGATARRAFMLCAQLLRHVDGGEPIRFLIAECESAFTLLAALYFATLYGVSDRIDISPLFETEEGLERGAEIVDEALSYPVFQDYVRRRGRLCIQTGFSDAGRAMGQIAAAVAIERIRIALAEVLHRHRLEVELVIFDTHGESLGRGAHPASFRDRLLYYDTPHSRLRFQQAGIRQCQESSFQGGDGYLPFLREESALAVLTRVLEHRIGPSSEPDAEEDPFYSERIYVDEFFAAVRQFNRRLMHDPDYAVFLDAFGTHWLGRTGSRPQAREQNRPRAAPARHQAVQLRAIPHNAILHQLGVLVHVIGGVGAAMARDPQRFDSLYRRSDRFRRLLSMVEHAFKFTDPRVTAAYLELFDPTRWLALASARADGEVQAGLRSIADHMERQGLSERLPRIFRFIWRDHLELARALRDHRRRTRDLGQQPIAVDAATRDNLHLLHVLRLALIQRLMLYAVAVPDFSDRHALTREEVVARLLRLDVEDTLDLLARVFPLEEDGRDERDYGDPASHSLGAQPSYIHEHERLFRPIAQLFGLIRRVGTAVCHHIGAFG